MKILVISDNYPSTKFPNTGVFLYNLVQEMVLDGNSVTVISPQILTRGKFVRRKIDYGLERAKVYRPFIISFSTRRIFSFNLYFFTIFQQVFRIRSIVRSHSVSFDIIYCQFLSNSLIAARAFPKCNYIFADVGEFNNINKVFSWYNKNTYFKLLKKINGFIAVSPFVKERLLEKGVSVEDIVVEGNGVNSSRFFPRDRNEMRKRLNLPFDKFIVVFIGHFISSKGAVELLKAAELDGFTYIIFLGSGELDNKLVSNHILFKGVVPNSSVADYLCAGDVFVLPTHHEGSNNSILEAMACGLPIISSNIPEVRLQIPADKAILIDPTDVSQIAFAIHNLRTNKSLLRTYGDFSLNEASLRSVRNRWLSIRSFIADRI